MRGKRMHEVEKYKSRSYVCVSSGGHTKYFPKQSFLPDLGQGFETSFFFLMNPLTIRLGP